NALRLPRNGGGETQQEPAYAAEGAKDYSPGQLARRPRRHAGPRVGDRGAVHLVRPRQDRQSLGLSGAHAGAIARRLEQDAGVEGGQPGIFMPATPVPGPPYRQEYMRGTAEDMGQVVATNQAVQVPAGAYPECVRTKDWSLLEAGHDFKWYAKGVGLVRSESA